MATPRCRLTSPRCQAGSATSANGWILSFHAFTHYIKVTFFQGTSLRPLPPGPSKHKDVRYVDIHEDGLDEALIARWVKQAAALPGWSP